MKLLDADFMVCSKATAANSCKVIERTSVKVFYLNYTPICTFIVYSILDLP